MSKEVGQAPKDGSGSPPETTKPQGGLNMPLQEPKPTGGPACASVTVSAADVSLIQDAVSKRVKAQSAFDLAVKKRLEQQNILAAAIEEEGRIILRLFGPPGSMPLFDPQKDGQTKAAAPALTCPKCKSVNVQKTPAGKTTAFDCQAAGCLHKWTLPTTSDDLAADLLANKTPISAMELSENLQTKLEDAGIKTIGHLVKAMQKGEWWVKDCERLKGVGPEKQGLIEDAHEAWMIKTGYMDAPKKAGKPKTEKPQPAPKKLKGGLDK